MMYVPSITSKMELIIIIIIKVLYSMIILCILHDCYPVSLAWDVDISLVRRVFLVKSMPTSAHTLISIEAP